MKGMKGMKAFCFKAAVLAGVHMLESGHLKKYKLCSLRHKRHVDHPGLC